MHAAVAQACNVEEEKKLKEYVPFRFNCIELWLGEFYPLMGYATGKGTFSIAFYVG